MRDGKLVLMICALAALTFAMCFYRGGPFNRHEWLNDTMKQTAKNGLFTSVDVGAWKNTPNLHEPAIGEAGRVIYWDTAETLHGEMAWHTVFDVSKANYTFMKVTTPDHHCFVVDICLKHGETRLQKCVP